MKGPPAHLCGWQGWGMLFRTGLAHKHFPLPMSGGGPVCRENSGGPWVAVVYILTQHQERGFGSPSAPLICSALLFSSLQFSSHSDQLKYHLLWNGAPPLCFLGCHSEVPFKAAFLSHGYTYVSDGDASGRWGVCLSSESSAVW